MSFGDLSGEDTPGNIPNPVVKLTSADGTWGGTPWESKSLPKDFLFLIAMTSLICAGIYSPFLQLFKISSIILTGASNSRDRAHLPLNVVFFTRSLNSLLKGGESLGTCSFTPE